ncbi:MAG: type II toxin-antitoxin system Phd/YefM family antitoxin [Gammaproteobacteria bacterium]|nr:type II toxin-antitoxin system Phd/YefM family antitoxin [Gammaproteobacteria bacterium]MYD77059.1 type II toxin-antitoxin system Phd/YefM family antitoxin [Gammaproteobacteria bacterium]MYJ53104.1 type II toxin-antitoxin system Phd/YefM family antitoxin [Gammaproteobacteria bacterium]
MTVTSRRFNQSPSGAKRAEASNPVIISDHGKPVRVPLGIEACRKLSKERRNLLDAVSIKEFSDTDFDPPRIDLHKADCI